MSDLASGVECDNIEIRPSRGGQCFEHGVQPYWSGEDAKQSAIDYARARRESAIRRFCANAFNALILADLS